MTDCQRLMVSVVLHRAKLRTAKIRRSLYSALQRGGFQDRAHTFFAKWQHEREDRDIRDFTALPMYSGHFGEDLDD